MFYEKYVPYPIKIYVLTMKYTKEMPTRHSLYFCALSFCSLLIFSVILFKSPILLLFFILWMAFIQALAALAALQTQWFIYIDIKPLLNFLINYLHRAKVLKLFYFIHYFWYEILTFRGYKFFTILLGVAYLYYLIISRCVLSYKLNLLPVPSYLLFLYIIGLFFLYIRFISNFSNFIIPYVFTHSPHLGEMLLTDIPNVEDIPNKPEPETSSSARSRHRFRPRFSNYSPRPPKQPPELPPHQTLGWARRFSLIFAGGTLIVGSVGCMFGYYQLLEARKATEEAHKAALAAQTAAEAAVTGSKAAVKANDLQAYQAKLITKEEYYRRHPEDIKKK